MGRPKKIPELTEQQIQELASIGCTDEEIARLAGLGETTLQTRFGALLKQGRAQLRENLRKAQVKRALGGSDTMLIWLGKQYLGQSDKTQTQQITDPIDWGTVPAAVRTAFIENKIGLEDVHRAVAKSSR